MSPLKNILQQFSLSSNLLIFSNGPYCDSLFEHMKFTNIHICNRKYEYDYGLCLEYKDPIDSNIGYNAIVVFDDSLEYDLAIKLSRIYHIPLICLNANEGFDIANRYHQCLTIGPHYHWVDHSQLSQVKKFILQREKIDMPFFLVREEMAGRAGVLGLLSYNVAAKRYARYEQYKSSIGYINFYDDCFVPELVECSLIGLPAFTVPNKYHKNIPTFETAEDLNVLLGVYNKPYRTKDFSYLGLEDGLISSINTLNNFSYEFI